MSMILKRTLSLTLFKRVPVEILKVFKKILKKMKSNHDSS